MNTLKRVRNIAGPYIAEEEARQLNLAAIQFQEPLCDLIGFQNHEGECCNDALQEIFLFSDGLKEHTQPLIYSLDTSTLYDRIEDSLSFHTNTLNAPGKTKYIQAYIDYITLMKIRFITHYNYILAQRIVRNNSNRTTRKRRMSRVCGIGAAAKMVSVFKGESNTYRAGIKSEHRNLVFTNLCSIFRIPYVAAPYQEGYRLDPAHTAFFISSIAYQTSDMRSIGGHAMAIIRCNGAWNWYDDNTGVHPISQKSLEMCLDEKQFGYTYDGSRVWFLKLGRRRNYDVVGNSITQRVEQGGLVAEITHRLEDDTWVPFANDNVRYVDRIYGIHLLEGVFVVRPKRSIRQIMRNRKTRKASK